ncbi:MAG TPA: ABC transporter permease [Solirubrobacteraceae bacterium]|jgi:tungstate transport system permease protein|nr:ABC transporter permease [Solirubrobacteraceae bacterium]
MSYLWHQLTGAIPLIVHADPYLVSLTWVTIRVGLISTSLAVVIGLPIGLALGLGRFRGRRALQVLANASLALPPVVVGIVVLMLLLPQGPFGSLRIEFTLTAVYIVQAILALPFIVALTPAAVQGLPPGLIAQARALGANRRQTAMLALREARIGVMAAVIAALGATVSEVGAVIIVGGNFQGHDETLASALLSEFTYTANAPYETAIALILLVLVIVLIGGLTVVQRRTDGIRWRFRAAT